MKLRYYVKIELIPSGNSIDKWITAHDPDDVLGQITPHLTQKYGEGGYRVRKVALDDDPGKLVMI